MIKLYASNSLDFLFDRYSLLLEDRKSPFETPFIVVQSKAMQSWLTLKIAETNGIFANIKFFTPNGIVDYIFRQFLSDVPEERIFYVLSNTFKIMQLIKDNLQSPDFMELKNYLHDEEDDLKLVQISGKIADLFDQYITFRPEMILNWDTDEDKSWQAQLWRKLKIKKHPSNLREELFEFIKSNNPKEELSKQKISLFAINYLPPFHLEILNAISEIMEVNLFLLSPTKHYWGDIKNSREISYIQKKSRRNIQDLHFDTGNSMLASMGKSPRDFQQILYQYNLELSYDFLEPKKTNLLKIIQNDIFNLEERNKKNRLKLTKDFLENDNSISINICHSRKKEIEILHDYILSCLDDDSTLQLSDILIMAPDINEYSQHIDSVFMLDRDPLLQYAISDSELMSSNSALKFLKELFDVATGRFSSLSILDLLRNEYIKKKFNLTDDDIMQISFWIKKLNVFWGINGFHREEVGLPKFEENSWEWGIKRILLGYSFYSDVDFFQGIVPYPEIESNSRDILNKFLEFFDSLKNLHSLLSEDYTLEKWKDILDEIIEDFFRKDDSDGQLSFLLLRLNEFKDVLMENGYKSPLNFKAIRYKIFSFFNQKRDASNFFNGKLTFCSMLPMRSIPFKIICILGFNNGDFPRKKTAPGFDIISNYPELGDRSVVNDDRYTFLEEVLSVQKRLFISYLGYNILDNSERLPSVLLAEFIDYINNNFYFQDGTKDVTNFITRRHPLQSFDLKYFLNENNFFSYSKTDYEIAKSILKQYSKEPSYNPIVLRGFPKENSKITEISISDFISFFKNPAEYFFKKRAGVILKNLEESLLDKEYFSLTPLSQYSMAKDIFSDLSCFDEDYFFQKKRGEGILPYGNLGELYYDEFVSNTKRILKRIKELTNGENSRKIQIDISLDNFRITGEIPSVYANELILAEYSKLDKGNNLLNAKYILKAWVLHLILNISEPEEYNTRLFGRDKLITFCPSKNFKSILKKMIQVYLEGNKKIIPFSPMTSFAYLINIKKNELKAKNETFKSWFGNDYFSGELENSYNLFAYKDYDIYNIEFFKYAVDTFFPILDYKGEEDYE